MGFIQDKIDGYKTWLDQWGPQFFYFFVLFLDNATYFMLQPAFGIVFQERLNPTNFELGAFNSAFGISMAVAQLYYGYLGDVFGRGPVLCFSLFCGATSWFFIAWARNPFEMILARAFQGATTGTYSLLNTIILEMTPEDSKTVANAYVSTTTAVAISVGPAIGGVMIGTLGFDVTCYTAAVLMYCAVLTASAKWCYNMPAILKRQPTQKEGQIEKENPAVLTFRVFKRNPLLLVNVLALFVNVGGVSTMAVFFPLACHLINGMDPLAYGIWVSIATGLVVYFGLTMFFINLSEKHGLAGAFRISQLLKGASYLTFCIQIFGWHHWIFPFLTLFFWLAPEFAGSALLNTLVVENADPDAKGTLMGVFWFVRQSSEFFWPMVTGILTEIDIFMGSDEAKSNGMYFMCVWSGFLTVISTAIVCQTQKPTADPAKEALLA